MVNNISEEVDEKVPIDHIIEELEKAAKGDISSEEQKEEDIETIEENKSEENSTIPLNEYDLNVIKQAEDKGFNAYEIKIILSENTLLKSARAFLIFKNLEEYGEVIKSLPIAEDIENENFDFEIDLIYLTTKGKEEIYDILENISEVDNVMVDNVDVQLKREEKIESKEVKEKVKEQINNIDTKKLK